MSDNLLNSLITEYENVRSLLRKAGFELVKVAYSRRRLDQAMTTPEGITRIYQAIDYLKALQVVHGTKFQAIYIQRTPEQWAQYEPMGLTQLNEYRLLQVAKRALWSGWKIRPEILRRDGLRDPVPLQKSKKKKGKK